MIDVGLFDAVRSAMFTSLHVFALAVVALFLKCAALPSVQAWVRMRSKRFKRAEDAERWGGTVDDHPTAVLAQSAIGNDLENIPLFVALLGAAAALDIGPLPLALYASVFVAARSVHSFAYVRPRQPLRNRAYTAGLGASALLAGHVLYAVMQA